MEDIEIEYLDEYKDLVLPGINKTSGEGRAAASASLDQAMSRLPQRRRTSSDSSSSSIDPDIFQKLFDGKLFDDELLNESSSNAKGILRRSLSSSSSDSNDALDALYNRQSSRKVMTKKRNRIDSYDSLDDLGDALMGSTHKLSLPKTNSSFASKKAPSLQRVTSAVKSKSTDNRTPLNKPSSSSVINAKADVARANGGSSSSSSSNHQLLANRKKAVTIIKAQKPDLKPPKHEPRMDPLHLQDFADGSDSDSSFEYESDSYGDSDDGTEAGARQIIDISTDTSATPSVTDTVTPVVSEDEGHQQLQQQLQQQHEQQLQQTPNGNNDLLQSYLNNLSCAETPPSNHKYKCLAKKSRSNVKTDPTSTCTAHEQVNESTNQALVEGKRKLDEPEPGPEPGPQSQPYSSTDKLLGDDYVDVNITYESVERLSLKLAKQIINIDTERSKEFEKLSGSKKRSNSSSKVISMRGGSLSSSHVRKLTYSNEALDNNKLRRAKSECALSRQKRRRQSEKRISLTEEQIKCRWMSPPKKRTSTAEEQSTVSPKKLPDTTERQSSTESQMTTEKPQHPVKEKRKRGRPRKNPEMIPTSKKSVSKNPDNKLGQVIENEKSNVESKVEMSLPIEAEAHCDKVEKPAEDTNLISESIVQPDTSCKAPSLTEIPSAVTVSSEITMEQLNAENETEIPREVKAVEMTVLDSAEKSNKDISAGTSVNQCINEYSEKVEQIATVTEIEDKREIITEKTELDDKEAISENPDKNTEITEEKPVEETCAMELSKGEEKDIELPPIENKTELIEEKPKMRRLHADKFIIGSQEAVVEGADCSAKDTRKTLRSAMANPEKCPVDNEVCKNQKETTGGKNKSEQEDSSKEKPNTCKVNAQDESDKASSKAKNTVKRSPISAKSLTKNKSRSQMHKSSTKQKATSSTVLTESSLDSNTEDASSGNPTPQDIPVLSEEQPTNDNTIEINNEDVSSGNPTPQDIPSLSEKQPTNDNITLSINTPESDNVKNNSLNETKNLRSKKISKVEEKPTPSPSEEESNSENPVSVESAEWKDTKDNSPTKRKSARIKPQSKVYKLSLTKMSNLTTKTEGSEMLDVVTTNSEDQRVAAGVEENTLTYNETPVPPEIELEVVDNMISLNEILTTDNKSNEEISQLTIVDDKQDENVITSQDIDELKDSSHQDSEDPIKIKPRNLLIKEMRDLIQEANEVEGPTTRSRSATPATLFRSRVKELTENPQNKESSKITRAAKMISFSESIMDTPKQRQRSNKMRKEANTAEDQTSCSSTGACPESESASTDTEEPNKSVNREKSSRKHAKNEKSKIETKKSAEAETEEIPDAGISTPTKSAVPSTPSTSSSCQSTRKLRVLMKKSAAQSFHTTISLDQQEHAEETVEIREDTEPVGKLKDTQEDALTESREGDDDVDVESVQTEIQQTEVPHPTDLETDGKPNDLTLESADKDQHQEEPDGDQINNSSAAETTGVTTSCDKDSNDERIADDSLPDGNKLKQMLQTKLLMAPPATPNRELITGKAVLRRPGNPRDNDVQPEQKRRKLEGHFVELTTKSNDNQQSPSASAVMPKTGNGTGKANAAKKSLTIESPKKAQLTKGSPLLGRKPETPKPPVKSTLSALIEGISRPTTMDKSVIITKTAVGKTSDQFKRSEVSPSKVPASGINISVSVVSDAHKQLKTSPKKILTQTETGKKLMTMTATAIKGTVTGTGDNESQPAADTSKQTRAKPEKRSALPTKLAVSQEESKTTSLPPAKTAERRKKPISKPEAVANPVEPAAAATRVEAIAKAATESLPIAKLDKKQVPRKAPKKTVSKAKSKEAVSVQAVETGVATVERAASSVSSSRESSRERAKRATGAVKSMSTGTGVATVEQAVSSVSSSRESSRERARRATGAVKSMSTVTRATTVVRLAPTSTAAQLSPLPQRQPRRSQALKLAASEARTRPRTPPVLPAAAPAAVEEPAAAASHSRKRRLPVTSAAEPTVNSKRAKESVAFPVRITVASAVMMPASAAESPAAAPEMKLRKCRVRINRSVVKNWIAKQQQQQQQQEDDAAPAPAPPELVAAPGAQTKATQNITAGKSLPLPEPLLPVPQPVLEVKQEQQPEAMDVQQVASTTQSEDTNRLESNVATPSLLQVVAPTPRAVAPLQNSDNNSGNNNNNSNTSGVPDSGSSSSDVHTFGTTRMFSFLYPSRYQRSYGNVGLDFCCPNLDGPMQAIDPTRLHSKVEVPVLELPQYMVISTKIISKQDKNIPPKVRAKLEQLASKDGIPCVMQSVQMSTSSSSSTPPDAVPVPTLTPAIIQTPPVGSPMERVTKPLPRGPIQTKTAAATSAAVAPTVVSTPAVSDIYPGLLQLPPVCPTDKMRVELQTRVQLFDAVLQGLARRAVSLSVAERQRVIENIVSTSSLMPIDVDVGTKLLENYICYLNAATDTVSLPVPRVRSIVTMLSTPPAVSQGSKSNAVRTTQVKPAAVSSKPPPLAAISGRKAGGGGGGLAAERAAGAGEPGRRPIYDKDKKNIIGYQYKSQQTLVSPATRLLSKSSSSRSSTESAVGQSTRVMMPTARTAANTASNKLAVVSAVSSPRASASLRTCAPNKAPTVSGSSRNLSASNAGGSNLFIVNQILTHPEECILPDGVGTTDPVALDTEIKGEVEDADSLI